MALVGNGSVLHKSPGRFLSGTAGTLRSGFNKPGMIVNRFEQMDDRGAIPVGHLSPSAWALPRVAGGLSSMNEINGAGAFAGGGALGVNGEGALTGSGTISQAVLALVVSAVAALTGSGALTASIVGKLEAAADLAGSGNLSAAAGALASLLASLTGAGSVAGTPYATGDMSADIAATGDALTAGAVASAVWSAVAVSNNDPGTMGEKLNDAGSSGNPWATVIESGYTAEQILRLLAAYAAGAAVGLEDGAFEFTGIDGSTVRITGTVDGNDRTIADLDGT